MALAVQLRSLGAEVRVAAPPDLADLLARVGVPLVPAGPPVHPRVHGSAAPKEADLPQRAVSWVAGQFDTVTTAAEGCDAVVAVGIMQVGARSVAEKLGIRYVYANYQPVTLPSPHHPPVPFPGHSWPAGVTDNEVLWGMDAWGWNALFSVALNAQRAAIGLSPVDSVRDHVFTDHPWLAADPTLAPWPEPADLDVRQTGAWILPDERPFPADLAAFLDAGTPPVYVGFGSVRAPEDIVRNAIEANRAEGRRTLVARGWAGLTLIDEQDDCLAVGEVNQQALFGQVAAVVHHGGAGTTTAAARAGVPQVVVPQSGDQPYWAGRVADLGIGAAHEGPTPTAESLSVALKTALTPETRARATVIADKISTDGTTVAAELLLGAISRERPLAPA